MGMAQVERASMEELSKVLYLELNHTRVQCFTSKCDFRRKLPF